MIRLSSFNVSSNLSSINLSKPATPLSLALEATGSEERLSPGVSISLSLAGSYPSSRALMICDDSLRVGPAEISFECAAARVSSPIGGRVADMGGPGEVGDETVVPCCGVDLRLIVLVLDDACETLDVRRLLPYLPEPGLAISPNESIRSLTKLCHQLQHNSSRVN